jgi:tripartite ATP-independent transporter DctP family solute receptor
MKRCLLLLITVLVNLGLTLPAFAAEVEIALSVTPVLETPYGQGSVYWAKLLEEQSGGKMILNIFPSEQLGSTNAIMDQAIFGDPIITSTDANLLADLGVPDMAVVLSPYLAADWKDMDTLMSSDWWLEQEKLLEKKGLKVLARNWHYGKRCTITTRPVVHPADFKGLKIRTPMSLGYVKTFEALGATPTPMALSEVYSALQQGTIDGLENPIPLIYGNRYQEVAKYLLVDGHIHSITPIVCGTSFFDSLTPEQQAQLVKTCHEAGEEQNRLYEAQEQDFSDKLKAEGVTVTYIDHAEYAKAVEPYYAYPEFSNWTPGLYDRIQKILGR